jgi:hypothetical protein
VPFDVAFSLSEDEVTGYLIIFVEFEGIQRFNFNGWRFEKVKEDD